jgi:hypothetical protein
VSLQVQADQLRHAKEEARPLGVRVGLHDRNSACTDESEASIWAI